MKKRFLSLILTVSMVASCVMTTGADTTTDNVDLTDGLIGEYLFDGDLKDTVTGNEAVAYDEYDGYWAGTDDDPKPAMVEDASRGNVMEMKGTWQHTGYLKLDTDCLSEIETGFSVAMWAKANNSKATNNEAGVDSGLFCFYFAEQPKTNFAFAGLDVSLTPWINDGSDNWIDRPADKASTVQISTTEWNFVVMTIDATNSAIKVYVDGEETYSASALGGGSIGALLTHIQSAKEIQVGTLYPWWDVWDYRGYTDDVRMYNRALSAAEVEALMNVSSDASVLPINTIGAQTKANDQSVLGFVTTLSKDVDLDAVKEMGVIVKNSATATASEMVLSSVTEDGAIRKIETNYVTDLTVLDSNKSDAMYAFRSVITDISDTAKEYTAVPYIEYADGTVVYGSMVTRSIDEVK